MSDVDLREQCVDFLTRNPYFVHDETHAASYVCSTDNSTVEWTTYLSHMLKDITHGDNLTLQAMAILLHVQFLVVFEKQSASPCTSNIRAADVQQFSTGTGHCDEDKNEHYVSLKRRTVDTF